MSTHFCKPGKIDQGRDKQGSVKSARSIYWVLLLFVFCTTNAQQKPPVPIKYGQADLENLYNDCEQAREDTVNRICLGFLASHNLRKNAGAFYDFCTAFKNLCLKKNGRQVYRRGSVVELQGRLRLDSASAIEVNKKFEALFNDFVSDADYPAALECLFELGKFPQRVKNNIQSIKVLFFAEKFAEKYKLKQKISYQGILHYIGYILWDLDKPEQSISYFKRSLATGYVIAPDSMVTLNALGMNYQKLDSPRQSLYYFNEAGRIALAAKNDVFNTVVLGSAAATLLQLGEVDKAYDYSMRYKNSSVQYRLWENAVDAFCKLIQIELVRNNTRHAKTLLDSLDNIMPGVNGNDLVSIKRHKEAVYLYYEKLKNYEKALPAYKEFVHYDSLFQDYGNRNKISELELNAEVRLYEEEMAAKERTKRIRNIIEFIGIILLMLVVVFLIRYWYKKTKRAEQDKTETDKINLEQATEIQVLKQQLLDQLTVIRNDNINYQAQVALQNDTHSDIEIDSTDDPENDPKEIRVAVLVDDESTLNEKPGDIQFLKEYNLTQKEHWAAFKDSFTKIYPGFEKNIIGKMGAVSGAELRLMMLTKLGLNNKEIAQTLLISPDSVKKGKYRLYKKIGINSAAELNEFL